MRRALKPVFSIADDLERRLRYSGLEAIILELANDQAEYLPPKESLCPPRLDRGLLESYRAKTCK